MSTTGESVPYLRSQVDFPQDPQGLSIVLDREYIDIASKVNARVIGIYSLNTSLITGESWYLGGSQSLAQTFRQLYLIEGTGNIEHDIDFNFLSGITRLYGTFTDGTNWYPLPYVDVVNATNQVNMYITPTDIVITAGGGAPPTVVSGYVVVEFLSI